MNKQLFLLLLIYPAITLAQINKCIVSGKTIFTDEACPENTAIAFEIKAPSLVIQEPTAGKLSQFEDASQKEQQAAKELYIDGLRLLEEPQHGAIKNLGITLAYTDTDVRPGNGKYFCSATSKHKALKASALLDEAISRLPERSVRPFNLKYVLLCGEVKAGETSIGGFPVPPLNLLLLAQGPHDTFDHDYFKKRFFHEFLHFIEYRDNSISDVSWQSQFGNGYANSYQDKLTNSKLGSATKGFLNTYSTTYAREERAEFFAYIMHSPKELANFIAETNDPLLKRKAHFMMEKIERLLDWKVDFPRY